ncbi:RNA-directed DNA polymerase from mobile element jockey [Trichonephila clavipes]|nr:RNA-directed DNA polymerase from mobile element jockey [Trichonephila clavipes]
MTGKYIKVQPGSIDDHRDITALLEARKAEHYVIDRLANRPIKVVIKGLPVDTDVADIEANLKRWDELLACLEAEDGSLWNASREFRKKAPPIPALKGPAKIAYSDTDKSEIIADSLQNQFKLNDINNDTDRTITHVVHNYLENENNFTNIPPISTLLPSEIIEYIDNNNIKKAAGIDRISNRMLKHLPLISIFELTNIITNIIKLGYFPLKWKTAAVIPILKPGKDPTKADSFRPIALLSVLGKVFEKIILIRMYHHVDSISLIIPEQHGFRPNLSTSHQLLRVVETIRSGFRKQKFGWCGFP